MRYKDGRDRFDGVVKRDRRINILSKDSLRNLFEEIGNPEYRAFGEGE